MLPKLNHPIHNIEVPSLKKKKNFRPFLVKEEKILLMAKESDDSNDILVAVKQIVNNCSLDPNFNIDDLALFDLEYIFLQLRAVSVDDVLTVSYRDNQDEKIYDFDIKLKDIKIDIPKETKNIIKITDDIGMIMKYPSTKLYEDKEFLNEKDEQIFKLIVRCVDKIYKGDEIYDLRDYSSSEIEDFLENLSVKVFEQVQTFFENCPKLHHTIKYKNSLGNERTIELNSLNDFFTWR
jgi:hypothetical protein